MASLALFLWFAAQDAGPACAPACDGNTVTFCDDDEVATIDCAQDVHAGSTCRRLSAEWGDDCVLPEGAPCDPGYAFGASRCDPGPPRLSCIDGVCAPGAPASEDPLEPTPGTTVINNNPATTNPFGCSGCPQSAGAWVAALLALLRARNARARRAR
jgi:hypothetical protein